MMDWSLLRCARKGHITYAPDEPSLRNRLMAPAAADQAWRCLRCGTFVLGEPTLAGPVGQAPQVRRGKELRGVLILRFFAVERMVRAVIVAAAAYAIWRFQYSRVSIQQAFEHELGRLSPLFRQLGYDLDHSKLVELIRHAFTLNSTTLRWFAVGLAAYAIIEVVEAVGLWLAKRWGEYFAMVATSAGLPFEIYELAHKITFLRVGAFLVNVALVAYLVYAKRLFGVRGGAAAYEARLRSESIIDVELRALAEAGNPSRAAGTAGPGASGAPVMQGEPGTMAGASALGRVPQISVDAGGHPRPAGPGGVRQGGGGADSGAIGDDGNAAGRRLGAGPRRQRSAGHALGDSREADGTGGSAGPSATG